MSMFLARIVGSGAPQVYQLTGRLFFEPRSWLFVSYRRGASAIDYTSGKAVQAAQRRFSARSGLAEHGPARQVSGAAR